MAATAKKCSSHRLVPDRLQWRLCRAAGCARLATHTCNDCGMARCGLHARRANRFTDCGVAGSDARPLFTPKPKRPPEPMDAKAAVRLANRIKRIAANHAAYEARWSRETAGVRLERKVLMRLLADARRVSP